ncbi:hypothetical protein NGRA_3573, partial [Nosema granulosis]
MTIYREYHPFGELFDTHVMIDDDYCNKIKEISLKYKTYLDNFITVDEYLEEAFLEMEFTPVKYTLEDFYFDLFKNNIQLFHFNIYMFTVKHLRVKEMFVNSFFKEFLRKEYLETKVKREDILSCKNVEVPIKWFAIHTLVKQVKKNIYQTLSDNFDFLETIFKNDKLKKELIESFVKWKQ